MKIAEAEDRDESHKLRENGIGEVQSADPPSHRRGLGMSEPLGEVSPPAAGDFAELSCQGSADGDKMTKAI